jgi:hypothetical protein
MRYFTLAAREHRARLRGLRDFAMVFRQQWSEIQMTERYKYESEVDAMIRKMREDPKIEAERKRNWQYWWQPEGMAARDANVKRENLGTQANERDMGYARRRDQPQGGQR